MTKQSKHLFFCRSGYIILNITMVSYNTVLQSMYNAQRNASIALLIFCLHSFPLKFIELCLIVILSEVKLFYLRNQITTDINEVSTLFANNE